MDETAVIAGYDRLLKSIGARADEIADRPVVTHWPHNGSAYRGLVIVGQAVYGWGDNFTAAQFQTEAGRDEGIAAFRVRVDKPDPLHWIDTHPVRNSPSSNRTGRVRPSRSRRCSRTSPTSLQ